MACPIVRRYASGVATVNGTGTVVVVFGDLVGSTALMTAVGDDAADLIRREMFTKWRAAIDDAGGSMVKTAGDGFMAVFQGSASDTVRGADALRAAMTTIDSPRPLQLRIGIAAGEVSHEDGDWFGTPVVEAARLCAAADPDEVLLSETARNVIGSRGGHSFSPVGSLTLKGLGQPIRTYALGARARRRRNRRRTRWLAAGVVVALLAAAAAIASVRNGGEDGTMSLPSVPAPRGYVPTITDRACTPEESAGDSTVTCHTLEVPETRDRPGDGVVRLAVVRAPATDARASAVPAVLLDPDGQLAGDARRAGATLIRLGIRGRGDSAPQLSCSEMDASRTERFRMSWSDSEARFETDLDACLERLHRSGIDLSQYDQGDVADDVRDLVFALELPRVSLVAAHQFTRAAHVVIRRYPALLESVLMIDPDVPPTITLSGLGRFDASLGLLAQRCAEAPACNTGVPGGLVAAIDAVRERFRANPARITVGTSEGPIEVLVDDGVFLAALATALMSSSAAAVVPSVVTNGDPVPIAAYFAGGHTRFEGVSALFVIESCADAYRIDKPLLEAQAAALPRWSTIAAPSLLDLCAKFDLQHDPDATTPPVSAVPVFVVRGALTPNGTPGELSNFAAGLSHFSLLELPNESADLEGAPPCARALSIAFLRDRGTQLDTKSCETTDPPVPFTIS